MSFEEIKHKLIEAPALTCPDFNRTFILQTDASDVGLGVVLTQNFDDGQKVIAHASATIGAQLFGNGERMPSHSLGNTENETLFGRIPFCYYYGS